MLYEVITVVAGRSSDPGIEEILYDSILDTSHRFDGRRTDEVRSISIEVGMLPRTHGSALFTRGETQALSYNFV